MSIEKINWLDLGDVTYIAVYIYIGPHHFECISDLSLRQVVKNYLFFLSKRFTECCAVVSYLRSPLLSSLSREVH